MPTSPELLKQTLDIHGDALYRMALLLCGTDRDAERLLQRVVTDLVTSWGAAPPSEIPTEPALLTMLLHIARSDHAKRPQRRTPRSAALPALYRSVLGLPFEQRAACALLLVYGYDIARIATVLAVDEAAARTTLITTIQALAPATGHSLTDRITSEMCHEVRAALADPTGRIRHSAAVRGHLAGCSPCRSFDLTWGEVCQVVEAALREVLRVRTLPANLAVRLIQLASPRKRPTIPWRSLRFALPPLAVLVLVAVLVLPGFGRTSVTVVTSEESAPVDPRALVALATDRFAQPPENGPPIQYQRFETLWYFDDTTIAPIHADLWLDRDQPARHRIQLAHTSGGAPYELQLGDGNNRLYYALDSTYAPALYSNLNLRIEPGQPLLLSLALEPAAQREAFAARLESGPWIIPTFYLRQAAAAEDLRFLGRQREEQRTVQIVSFTGFSPFGYPSDAPGATAERVTVLLAIDPESGLLYSATELAGPPGGVQTSRTTWRLVVEEALAALPDSSPFRIERAWNGIGDFPDRPRPLPADLRVPAISMQQVIDPIRLLESPETSLIAPSVPPAGVERALILGEPGQVGALRVNGLIYVGPERMLLIRPINASEPPATEELTIAGWQAELTPRRGQGYVIRLARETPNSRNRNLLIEARGFSRSELLQMIETLAPFDLSGLAAQEPLFVHQAWDNAVVRSTLINLLAAQVSLPAEQVRYTRWRTYARHGPPQPPGDPYGMPAFYGRPEIDVLETWQSDDSALLQRFGNDPNRRITLRNPERSYFFFGNPSILVSSRNDVLNNLMALSTQLPQPYNYLPGLLASSASTFTTETTVTGETLISISLPADQSRYLEAISRPTSFGVYLADLQPQTIISEILFDADNQLQRFTVRAGGGLGLNTAIIVESFELLEQRLLPLSDVEPLLSGTQLPAAALSIDLDAPFISSNRPRYTIAEIVRRAESPVFILPSEQAQLEMVLAGSTSEVPFDDWLIGSAINRQLGSLQTYRIASEAVGSGQELQILQGPAEPLRAYIRLNDGWLWYQGVPQTINIAGDERAVWVGTFDDRTRLIAEIDGTLLLFDGSSGWFEEVAIPLLAELQPA